MLNLECSGPRFLTFLTYNLPDNLLLGTIFREVDKFVDSVFAFGPQPTGTVISITPEMASLFLQ